MLADRKGVIRHVIIGDHHRILIPDISAYRRGRARLKGLRCIHTHLQQNEGLSLEDLTDMALLRLDSMLAIEMRDGIPGPVHMAYLLPPNPGNSQWHVETYRYPHDIKIPFERFILDLENQIEQRATGVGRSEERAILIHAGTGRRSYGQRCLEELAELASSADIEVVDSIWQRVNRYNPAHLMGKGKLQEILMKGLYLGATMIIFDQDLSPVQVNNIAGMVDLKVIDRTQLILDIFAQRARTKGGKIQVELAQLRYLLPRLVGRGIAMSRLTGGIGGRGPGETKLEVDRRRVKQRIASLERDLKLLGKRREETRKRRRRREIPQVSIIGYTNAGKSTLLNRLTGSHVMVEDRLFATLDPTTRVFETREGKQMLLADTVGFIRHMPKDIKLAFKATLEELRDADRFIHLVDITSPFIKEEIETVEDILEEMGLSSVPRILVYNKMDLLDTVPPNTLPKGLYVSAKTGFGLDRLKAALNASLGRICGMKTRASSVGNSAKVFV